MADEYRVYSLATQVLRGGEINGQDVRLYAISAQTLHGGYGDPLRVYALSVQVLRGLTDASTRRRQILHKNM